MLAQDQTLFRSRELFRSQRLGLKYMIAAVTIFGAMVVFGFLASLYYIFPGMLHGVFDFNMSKTMHIDGLVIWILMGLMGAIYWYLPKELGREVVGIRAAEILFWVFVAAFALVVLTFLFVQTGKANFFTLWFIQAGRKYVEAPLWAAVGITIVMVTFAVNIIGTAFKAHRMTGLMWVLALDMIPLVGVYLDAFSYDRNMSTDLYWWWWLVHMWVESTWEVLIGVIMAWVLMDVMGASRRIVETWLYIEVMLVLGAGILGLGHHYFWIGTPEYWLAIGGFFSALEPLPLLGMVVHAIYDAGQHKMKTRNRPAYIWITTEAMLNFIGAGIFGFMMTLPQINLFSHGTQWTASHGHFAFYGAYVCGIISVLYIVKQKLAGTDLLDHKRWYWAYGFLNIGMIGMVTSLLLVGMAQAFFGRAAGGSTLMAFVTASENLWFTTGLASRSVFGAVFGIGYFMLVWDLVTAVKKVPLPEDYPEEVHRLSHAGAAS